MSEQTNEKEEQILKAVKRVLTEVIKDTATEPGMRHPLSDNTINGLRDCLVLISTREQELAAARGESLDMRPRYKGDAQPQGDVVVPIDALTRKRDTPHE